MKTFGDTAILIVVACAILALIAGSLDWPWAAWVLAAIPVLLLVLRAGWELWPRRLYRTNVKGEWK